MRVSSGNEAIDKLLEGGIEVDTITTVYGPSGSGKTNIALIMAVNVVNSGKKAIFIDTEGGFSVERLKQVCKDHKEVMDNVLFFKPTSFKEQNKAIDKLKTIVNDKIGVIVVDSIAHLYRLELSDAEEIYEVNRSMGRAIGQLTEIARTKNIPILITNQVYSNFDDRDKINMVGGDLLRYGSKCLIELQKTPDGNRIAILKKHRSIAEEKDVTFRIVSDGIKITKEGKGFGLFK
jgi:DNA repair protein RadB